VPSVVMTARVRGLTASLGLPGKPGIVPRILSQLGRHPVALDVAATTQQVLGKDMTYWAEGRSDSGLRPTLKGGDPTIDEHSWDPDQKDQVHIRTL